MTADVRIHEAVTPDDCAEIAALARVIWHEHYPGIINHTQIDFMLAAGYTPQALTAEQARGARFLLARKVQRAVAFAGWSPDPSDATIHWLDKLYIAREARGAGVARALLDRAIANMAARVATLKLRVNRRNVGAVAAYERLGFAIERADVKNIGHGFVMDDYVMQRAI